MTLPDEKHRTWWFDITTLLKQLSHRGERPKGITRVVFELLNQALISDEEIIVKMVRFDERTGNFVEITKPEYERWIAHNAKAGNFTGRAEAIARKRLPTAVKIMERLQSRRFERSLTVRNNEPAHPFGEGDIYICLGAWWHLNLMAGLRAIREKENVDLRIVVLIHDCIPLLLPNMCLDKVVIAWNKQLHDLRAASPILVANSQNTSRDALDLIRPDLDRIPVVRMGDQFKIDANICSLDDFSETDAFSARPYVLIVGTIEARKNHVLAIRAWRELKGRIGSAMPELVFAGSWGWNTNELRHEVAADNYLDGHLHIVEAPSDALLSTLYLNAIFTLYPSHYEGWGLPVRESLCHGRICLTARNSALPEAGGNLAQYFENNDLKSLVDTLEGLISNPARRRRLNERIEREFQPIDWRSSWEDLARHIQTSTDSPEPIASTR